MKHAKLIEALGGPTYVGKRLGRGQPAVTRWKHDGIPPHAYCAVLDLAREKQIDLTLEDLAAANPLFGRKARSTKAVRPQAA